MMPGKLILPVRQYQDGADKHSHQATARESTQQREIFCVNLQRIHISDVCWFIHVAPCDKKYLQVCK